GFAKLAGRAVWSVGSSSVLGAALTPAPGPYRLGIRASAFPPIAPLSVGCKVNGKDVGSVELGARLDEATWTIEPNVLHDGVNRIEFSYPKTGQPAASDPASKDKRDLAVRFARFELRPNQ
ncbi:MAG TPA: hypothetical protein VMG12_09520, partial [Polyangiaceae bacterium]|nr:hypothetical protein [Polyangiaceae bacterium]